MKNGTPRIQIILSSVVSIVWIAVVLVPMFIKEVKVDAQIQIGVQGAMMLVLGAIFGVKLVRRGNNE